LHFHSGAGTVTGANFMLEGAEGTKILFDCGMLQGSKIADDKNWEPFPYDPKSVDALFVSHAHIDHVGRIARFVRHGYSGPIYSTGPTREIGLLLLEDSMGVLEKEYRQGVQGERIYEEADVKKAGELWKPVEYHEQIKVGEFSAVLRDAGHILGSAMVEITYNGKKLVYTGDLGNTPAPIVRDTEEITDATYLIMETVYGNRNHEDNKERTDKLRRIIRRSMKAGGTLMIPAFSVERTQDFLYEVNNMVENDEIPDVPIYLDSPLAIKVTDVYAKYTNLFNKATQAVIKSGDDIFKFPGLKRTLKTEESKAIRDDRGPKIIIAGSGMSNGGRIIHHEKLYLPDPHSTLLIASYQAAGTLGRMLKDGAKRVWILGTPVNVRAKIENLDGYSAHKDGDGLFDFVAKASESGVLKKVFMVLGEPASSLYMVQRVRDNLGVDAIAPERGDKVDLEF